MGSTDEHDEAWYEDLVRQYRLPVLRVLAHYAGWDSCDLEDLAQQTFILAWRKKDAITGDPVSWLFGAARRLASNHRRGRRRLDAALPRMAAIGDASADELAEVETRQDFLRAYHRLPTIDQEVIFFNSQGLSTEQIGKTLGLKTDAVRQRLHRARHKLRTAMNDGVDDGHDERSTRTGGRP